MSVAEMIIHKVEALPVAEQRQVLDFVKSLEKHPRKQSDGARMARVLEKLAKLNPMPEVDDPVAWQRDIREDRALPGRDD